MEIVNKIHQANNTPAGNNAPARNNINVNAAVKNIQSEINNSEKDNKYS